MDVAGGGAEGGGHGTDLNMSPDGAGPPGGTGGMEKVLPGGVVPRERALLDLAGEAFLARAVGGDVPGVALGEVALEGAIGGEVVGVGAEVIAEGKVAHDVGVVADLEDVELVGPLVPALAEIAAAGDAEFAEGLVAQGREGGGEGVDRGEVADDGHEVEDWLGVGARDGGASDVVDGDAGVAKEGSQAVALLGEALGPGGVVGDDADGLGHGALTRRRRTAGLRPRRGQRAERGDPEVTPSYSSSSSMGSIWRPKEFLRGRERCQALY